MGINLLQRSIMGAGVRSPMGARGGGANDPKHWKDPDNSHEAGMETGEVLNTRPLFQTWRKTAGGGVPPYSTITWDDVLSAEWADITQDPYLFCMRDIIWNDDISAYYMADLALGVQRYHKMTETIPSLHMPPVTVTEFTSCAVNVSFANFSCVPEDFYQKIAILSKSYDVAETEEPDDYLTANIEAIVSPEPEVTTTIYLNRMRMFNWFQADKYVTLFAVPLYWAYQPLHGDEGESEPATTYASTMQCFLGDIFIDYNYTT